MMGQGDKKIRIRRTNEQLDKEVISEFEKLVGEFGFGNVNLSATNFTDKLKICMDNYSIRLLDQ